MLNKRSFLVISIFFLIIFFSISPVLAQTNEGEVMGDNNLREDSGDTIINNEEKKEEVFSESAQEDINISLEDLNVQEARVLPDNPFYGLKRLGRGLKEALTFNPVKKQEVRLDNANRELADTKLLIKKSTDEENIKDVIESLEIYENKINDIKEDAVKLKERKAEGDSSVNQLLDNILDKQIKHQKVLGEIEDIIIEKSSTDIIENIQNIKDKTATIVGGIISEVEESSTETRERFDRVLREQRGSEFKEIKNLEIVKKIEKGLSEESRKDFHLVEENSFQRFANSINNLDEGERSSNFRNYVNNINGDELYHFEIFDNLKHNIDLPLDIVENIESAKIIVADRFQRRLDNFSEKHDSEFSNRMMKHSFANFEREELNFDKVRVIDGLRERLEFEDKILQESLDEERDQSIEKFKESFPDSVDDAERFQELSKRMAENPDPTTFRLIQELEREVMADPAKKEFIESMEREARSKFEERMRNHGDQFFEGIITTNREDIEILRDFQADFRNNKFRDHEPSFNEEEFFPPEFEDHGMIPGEEDFFIPEDIEYDMPFEENYQDYTPPSNEEEFYNDYNQPELGEEDYDSVYNNEEPFVNEEDYQDYNFPNDEEYQEQNYAEEENYNSEYVEENSYTPPANDSYQEYTPPANDSYQDYTPPANEEYGDYGAEYNN